MNLLLVKAESIDSANDDRGTSNATSSTAECPPASASASSPSGASAGAVVGTFFAGLAVGMIGMGWCCCRRQKASKEQVSSSAKPYFADPPPPERNLTDMTEVSLENANYA
jgi:hypothetical protein